jgi:alpha-glucosidase
MMLLTLRGTPTLYYGDEIGMLDSIIPPDRVQDPYEKNQPGLGLGRDPQRTPMQWDGSLHAGFSRTEPWLPIPPDFHRRNVKVLSEDPRSMLSLYKRLIELRRAHRALAVGQYAQITCEGNVMVFERCDGAERMLVALNFGHDTEAVVLGQRSGRVLLSTHLDRVGESLTQRCELRPDEGLIALIG